MFKKNEYKFKTQKKETSEAPPCMLLNGIMGRRVCRTLQPVSGENGIPVIEENQYITLAQPSPRREDERDRLNPISQSCIWGNWVPFSETSFHLIIITYRMHDPSSLQNSLKRHLLFPTWQGSNWGCQNVAGSGIEGVYCGGSPGFKCQLSWTPLNSPCRPQSKGGSHGNES